MWLVKATIAVLVALFAVLAIGGLLLPSGFTVTRSTVIAASPERVYALVADPRSWQRWAVWNRRDPAMRIEYSGPASGTGATWRWRSKTEGNGAMTFTDAEPARRVAYDLYFADFGTTSSGELRFEPKDGVTHVTWSMTGDTGKNPFYHWMALLPDRTVGKDFEDGLAGLKVAAEKS
jgi:uncharacterized protein YndB with AHSA1/START domain